MRVLEYFHELLKDRRRTAGLIFLAVFLPFSAALCLRQLSREGDLISSDGRGYFVHLPSIIVDGDIDYRNNLAAFGYHDRNHWPIGTAISWSPAYMVGLAVSAVAEGRGVQPPRSGQGFPEQLACCLATIAFGGATLSLIYLTLTRWFDPLPSITAVVGILLGTNLWYYLLCEPYMSHGVSTFWVAVLLFIGLTDQPLTLKRSLLIGVVAGLAALTRPQDGLALVAPMVWHLSRNAAKLKRTLSLLVLAGMVSLTVFSLQLFIWSEQIDPAPAIVEVSTSAPAPPSEKAENLLHVVPGGGHNWTSPNFQWAFVNAGNGLWTWHPLTFLAFLGLVLLARQDRRLSFALLSGYVALLYVVAAWSGQGQSFGSRMMCSALPVSAPGLAYMCSRYPKALKVTVALAMVANLYLAIRYRMLLAQGPPSIVIWDLLKTP